MGTLGGRGIYIHENETKKNINTIIFHKIGDCSYEFNKTLSFLFRLLLLFFFLQYLQHSAIAWPNNKKNNYLNIA